MTPDFSCTGALNPTLTLRASDFILFLVSYIGGLIAIVAASYRILQLPMSKAQPHQGKLVLLAVVILLGGAVLWFAENAFCPSLRGESTQSPPTALTSRNPELTHASIGLHFHAVFHVTCAAGPYLWILFAAHDRLENCGGDPKLRLVGSLLPVVVAKESGD